MYGTGTVLGCVLETQISLTLERSLLKSRKPQDLHHTSAQVVLRRAGLVDNPSELFARLTGIGKRAPVHVIAVECRWILGVLETGLRRLDVPQLFFGEALTRPAS